VPKILQALEDGTIDVGLMRACVLEGLPIERRNHFKVIEPAEDSPLACAHTSRLFPNWTVGAMSQVPSDVAKRISLALLTAPPQTEASIAWSTANSFKSIDQLYRELKWGRYEYLRHWTFTRVWEAVWPFALAALVAFLALMLHLRRVNALVERRTRELNDEAARRMALEESNTALLQKFHRYEQMSTMGMLSNMVAHEIRQPLSALRYALRTIEMAAARDEEDSAVIEKSCAKARRQTERINDIVEHVCSYARTDRRNLPINLSELIRETVAEAAQMKLIHHAVTLVLPDNVFITGNPLELQLVVLNLLKNSSEAAAGRDPHSKIALTCGEDHVELIVSDETEQLDTQALERIASCGPSQKRDGLGLGLSIVRSIISAHGGSIHFSARADKGLEIHIILPLPGGSS
jgi:two-component system sensor histidine kinase TtrS